MTCNIYQQIIPRARIGFKMVDTSLVDCNYSISNKHFWNNCFIENAPQNISKSPTTVAKRRVRQSLINWFTCQLLRSIVKHTVTQASRCWPRYTVRKLHCFTKAKTQNWTSRKCLQKRWRKMQFINFICILTYNWLFAVRHWWHSLLLLIWFCLLFLIYFD